MHAATCFGICHGGPESFGFIQQDIAPGFRSNGGPSDLDAIVNVDLVPHLHNDFPIHCHYTGLNQGVGFSA